MRLIIIDNIKELNDENYAVDFSITRPPRK